MACSFLCSCIPLKESQREWFLAIEASTIIKCYFFLICIRLKVFSITRSSQSEVSKRSPFWLLRAGKHKILWTVLSVFVFQDMLLLLRLKSECLLNPHVVGWKNILRSWLWTFEEICQGRSSIRRPVVTIFVTCLPSPPWQGENQSKQHQTDRPSSVHGVLWLSCRHQTHQPNDVLMFWRCWLYACLRSWSQFQRPVVVSNLVERLCSSRTADDQR